MTTQTAFNIEPNRGVGLLHFGMNLQNALCATSKMLTEAPTIYRHMHNDTMVFYISYIKQGLVIQFDAQEQVSCIKLQRTAPVLFASKAIAQLSKMDLLIAYQPYPERLKSLGTLLVDSMAGLGFDFNCKPFLQQVFVFNL